MWATPLQKLISAWVGTHFWIWLKPENVPFFWQTPDQILNEEPEAKTPIKKTIGMKEFLQKTEWLNPVEKHKVYLRIRDEKGIEVAWYKDTMNKAKELYAQSQQKKKEEEKQKRLDNIHFNEENYGTNNRTQLLGKITSEKDKQDWLDKRLLFQNKLADYHPWDSALQIGEEALLNVLPSALNLAKWVWYAIKNPIDTAESAISLWLWATYNTLEWIDTTLNKYIRNPVLGVFWAEPITSEEVDKSYKTFDKELWQITGLKKLAHNQEIASALWNYFVKRYWTTEWRKKAIAEDPMWVLSDAFMFISWWTSAGAKILGKAWELSKLWEAGEVAEDNIRLYRGLEQKFDKNYDLTKTDAPNGYSTWTDNPELARQYAGKNGFVYQIDLPKKYMRKEYIDENGDRVLFLNNEKPAGLNGVGGEEYLVYNNHDLYNPNLISEFKKAGGVGEIKTLAKRIALIWKLRKTAETADHLNNLAMLWIITEPAKLIWRISWWILTHVLEQSSGLWYWAGKIIKELPELTKKYANGNLSLVKLKDELFKTKWITEDEANTLARNIDINDKVIKQEDNIVGKIEEKLKTKESNIDYDVRKIPWIDTATFDTQWLLDSIDEAIKNPNVWFDWEKKLKEIKEIVNYYIEEEQKWNKIKTTDVSYNTLQKIKKSITDKLNFKQVWSVVPAEWALKKLYWQITELQETLPWVKEMNKKYAKDIDEINAIKKEIYEAPWVYKKNLPSKIRSLWKDTNRFKKWLLKYEWLDEDLNTLDDLLKIKDWIDKEKLPSLTENINKAQLNTLFGKDFVDSVEKAIKNQEHIKFMEKLLPNRDFSIWKFTTNLLRYPEELKKTAALMWKDSKELEQHLKIAKVIETAENTLHSTTWKYLTPAFSTFVWGAAWFAWAWAIGALWMWWIWLLLSNPKVWIKIFRTVWELKGLKKAVIDWIVDNLNKGVNLTKEQAKTLFKISNSEEFNEMIKK